MARKALWVAVPAAVSAVMASVWPDLIRYVKIKMMSYGNGHPENVPAGGRAAYPHPSDENHHGWRQGKSQRPTGGSTARDRTSVDPQEPSDRAPNLQDD
jgi:hypothetical protein